MYIGLLLTIIVIMRPGYGLTKERSFHRIFGTILGGLIAFGILYIVQDNIIISILCYSLHAFGIFIYANKL